MSRKHDSTSKSLADSFREAISRLETESYLIPDDEQATMRLFSVLTDLQLETEPKPEWPQALHDVIFVGEEAIPFLGIELNKLTSNPLVEVGVDKVGQDSLFRVQHVWKKQQIAKILYFAIALSYIRSPRVEAPLCALLEKNIQMWVWPRLIDDSIVLFDPFERVYIAIARALYWAHATNILPRLRAILQQASQGKNRMLNALPYALRAIGFLGTEEDIPLVEMFIDFSCPHFDMSEARVKSEARHALYALRHPDERESRANTYSDTWRTETGKNKATE